MSDTLVIYHGNCVDGFGAAYAAHRAINNAEFYPGVYQESPPDVSFKSVYLLDFCYKRKVIEQLAQEATEITILDHHKSAKEDLLSGEPLPSNVNAIFDMNRSGAVMAWEYFHKDEPLPSVYKYIQDRDLWQHKLPNTHEVSAALFSYPYSFGTWTGLIFGPSPIKMLTEEGRSILRKQKKDLLEILPQVKRLLNIGEHVVPTANLPYFYASEAGHILAEGYPFAATYFDTKNGRNFSLRSRDDGLDVSKIAVQYGGGGHRHAAGFTVPREHPLAKV